METLLTDWIIPILASFGACLGFCAVFNINGLGAVLCSLGGSLAWLAYLVSGPLVGHNELLQYFCASVVISIYAEMMARVRKCPVTGYLLVAFLPLVPGAGIYYTMEAAISGATQRFLEMGMYTLSIAGVLAVGVLVVSSLVQMIRRLRYLRRKP